ncbi:MAG: glycosyltransferase family 2 protein, partial [Fidelibacterota bacterium]
MMPKLISIVTPCFNEEDNIHHVYNRVNKVFSQLPDYDYEHIFIDNASQDNTINILKSIAVNDKHIKIIVNTRNFGHVVNGYYAMLQARGDAIVLLFADLQDPPELIPDFILQWETGSKVVLGVKNTSSESRFLFRIKRMYYRFISRLSDI